jgi:hypothetical protein
LLQYPLEGSEAYGSGPISEDWTIHLEDWDFNYYPSASMESGYLLDCDGTHTSDGYGDRGFIRNHHDYAVRKF